MSGIVGGINLRSSGLVNLGSASDGALFTGTGAGLPVGFEAAAGGGKLVQVVNVTDGELATGTTVHPLDDTIAQNTEGNEFLTLAITPTSATNKLVIEAHLNIAYNKSNREMMTSLFQDSTANALATAASVSYLANEIEREELTHYMTAGTTSSTTFKIRVGGYDAGTISFNGFGGSPARKWGGVSNSQMTIWEIEG